MLCIPAAFLMVSSPENQLRTRSHGQLCGWFLCFQFLPQGLLADRWLCCDRMSFASRRFRRVGRFVRRWLSSRRLGSFRNLGLRCLSGLLRLLLLLRREERLAGKLGAADAVPDVSVDFHLGRRVLDAPGPEMLIEEPSDAHLVRLEVALEVRPHRAHRALRALVAGGADDIFPERDSVGTFHGHEGVLVRRQWRFTWVCLPG